MVFLLPSWFFARASERTTVNVDVIGVGGSVVDCCKQIGIPAIALNGSESAVDEKGKPELDHSGKLGFTNRRSMWIWRFREALDPDYGSQVALPPDPKLKADLCAMRWRLSGWKIQIESKDEVKSRIGRSPDRGEGIIYASIPPRRSTSNWMKSLV
jgi:hypothetical protein